mgnify:FL=1
MQCTMLLWPHANARYQNETFRLARAELQLMLGRLGLQYEVDPEPGEMPPSIRFSVDRAFAEREERLISGLSLLYGLFERRPDGALFPVLGRQKPRFGSDLPGILKYKGKTNEFFTELLMNLAYLSGSMPEDPRVLDPLCGKGTTLFVAANRGFSAAGADVDRADLREAENFFKRYLEYHRVKHSLARGSMTLPDKKSSPYAEFTVDRQSLRFSELDAARVADAFGRKAFDLIAADLPYGVQHTSGELPGKLLERALPEWLKALRPGGAAAASFNAQTLSRERVRAMFHRAGFQVMEGGPYDALDHWVEQAVTRDVVVGVRG